MDRESLGVTDLVEESLAAWQDCGTDLPDLGRRYSPREQAECEQLADECLTRVETVMRDLRRRKLAPQDAQARITAALVELTTCALDVQDPYIDWLLGDRFGGVSTGLARQARQMDSSVGMIDILQAARNAWTACGIQALLGLAPQLTPAIFAYSMLYPYSDNYLDDPALSSDVKFAFSLRFRSRLRGDRLPAGNSREATIWSLVDIIEAQYPRDRYSQVYESLLAIHAAQEQSIRQLPHRGDSAALDILRLTFTKGGTSVLADACLAAGHLLPHEARFAFQWGVVLQLGDDLQDVLSDSQRGSRTLYTQDAARQPLDRITARTLHFGRWVMTAMAPLEKGEPVLKRLLQKSSQLLLVRSTAGAGALYTPSFLDNLQPYSPFRFEFLRRREQDLAARKREYAVLFEDLIRSHSVETRPRLGTFRIANVLMRQ
ncbi:MAG: hypothetical protein JO340_07485 [Acidobacteriaceae bacterium]|nr:hypothetical protein [Acidobacteriaceae bacterium]